MESLVSPVMSSDEAVDWKARISSCANQLRLLLFEGYERRAWEALGYGTWTDCLKSLAEEYRFSERRLWQLHAANESEQLLNHGSVGAIPERQLRPLAGLPSEQQQEVWHAAVETAPASGITAKHVQQTVNRVNGSHKTEQTPVKPKEPEPRQPPRKVVQDALITRLVGIPDKEVWNILALLWSELEHYYRYHPSMGEPQREISVSRLKELLPLIPAAVVEEFELVEPPEPSDQQALDLNADEEIDEPLEDTPVGQECVACGEWEGAGPTEPCPTCSEPVHAERCLEVHVYGIHTHPRRT